MLNIEVILPYYISAIILLVFAYLANKYFYSLQKQSKYFKYILLSLRFTVIVLLLIILFNPIIIKSSEFIKNKKIVFFIDNSESLSSNKLDLINKINYSSDYLNNKNIKFEFYTFSDTLKKINNISELTFDKKSTDFNQIFESINDVEAEHYILISDGMQNVGMLKGFDSSLSPINTFGVDSDSLTLEDLKFDSLSIRNYTDSISIKCHFSLNINNDYNNIRIRLSNDKYSNLNISKINVKSNQNILLHDIVVKKNILSKHNIISIENINSEINTINNYLELELDDKALKKHKILLVSGYISDNTRFIKNLLYKNNNIDFDHIIAMDSSLNIDSDNYDMVIVDSFLNDSQFNIINNKNFNSSKFVYFQGPILLNRLTDYDNVLSKLGYNLNYLYSNSSNIYLKLIGNNEASKEWIEKIIPFDSNFFITKNKSRGTIDLIANKKDYKKILLDYTKDSLFIFIPDLRSVSNQTKRFYSKDYLTYLVDYYISKIIKDDKILNIYSDKNNFYIDEDIKLYFDIKNKDYFQNYLIDLYIYDKEYNMISKIVEYNIIDNNTISFSNEGKYYVEAIMRTIDNVIIESGKIEFYIMDIDKELDNIGLNEELLRKISFQTNGQYYSIDNLPDYMNTIQQSESIILKLNRMRLFNFQVFWFIILLLLITEWILRKNRGLL